MPARPCLLLLLNAATRYLVCAASGAGGYSAGMGTFTAFRTLAITK